MTHPVSTPKLTWLVDEEELSLLTAVLCLWLQE